MRIRVTGYLSMREAISRLPPREWQEPLTVRQLLALLEPELVAHAGAQLLDSKTGLPGERLAVLINGRHCSHLPDRLDTALKDGDEIALFPPVAGG